MEDLIVIKTDKDLGFNVVGDIVKVTGATLVVLPMSCTITTKEEALKEMRNYKEMIERFFPSAETDLVNWMHQESERHKGKELGKAFTAVLVHLASHKGLT